MTTHYNIHILKTKTDFKAVYRAGKFKGVHHSRGDLDHNQALKYVGFLLPVRESGMNDFIKKHKDQAVYTNLSDAKPITVYTQFKNAWTLFFEKHNNISPKHEGAETNALKKIIAYLKRINNGDVFLALENWNLILSNWSSLSDFNQEQMDLKIINSRLNVIIRELIKNTGNVTGTNRSVSI